MSPETVFIAFGSNQGDRQELCDRAVALMRLLPLSALTGISSYYETEPVGLEGEANPLWFYNGVVRIETRLQPERLLALCQETERSLGRDPERRNGSRPIDLDLLFYGQRVIETPSLTVPHARLHQRRFVLAPMAELAPDWIHPRQRQSVQTLLDVLTDSHHVRKLALTPGSRYATRPSCSLPALS